MKKLITIILILTCLALIGCSVEKESENAGNIRDVLDQISVPDMSTSVLNLSESEQLSWLSEIYNFEVDTIRSKTTDLSEADIQTVKAHLSQVFGVDEIEVLIDGFYVYNEEAKNYYVPDGDWFTYNESWPSSNLAEIDRSKETVTFKLTGVDDYYGDEQEIHYVFKFNNNRLFLEKRSYIK